MSFCFEGWLSKRSSGLLPSWQKRFFRLSAFRLIYTHKQQQTKDDSGECIDLRLCRSVNDSAQSQNNAPLSDAQLLLSPKSKTASQQTDPSEFVIVTQSKIYTLRCPVREEKQVWLSLLSVFNGLADKGGKLATPIPISHNIYSAIQVSRSYRQQQQRQK